MNRSLLLRVAFSVLVATGLAALSTGRLQAESLSPEDLAARLDSLCRESEVELPRIDGEGEVLASAGVAGVLIAGKGDDAPRALELTVTSEVTEFTATLEEEPGPRDFDPLVVEFGQDPDGSILYSAGRTRTRDIEDLARTVEGYLEAVPGKQAQLEIRAAPAVPLREIVQVIERFGQRAGILFEGPRETSPEEESWRSALSESLSWLRPDAQGEFLVAADRDLQWSRFQSILHTIVGRRWSRISLVVGTREGGVKRLPVHLPGEVELSRDSMEEELEPEEGLDFGEQPMEDPGRSGEPR